MAAGDGGGQAAHTAIVRVEQLYPLRDEELSAIFARYANAEEIAWVQEEPANMGARTFIVPRIWRLRDGRRVYAVSRTESGSPATGSARAHQIEQRRIIDEALGTLTDEFGR
jgi:2-oxoglutarate dehydrogenase E1 component